MSKQPKTPKSAMLPLSRLNSMPVTEALEHCGGFFEHSPWIVEDALQKRPFASVHEFHAACMRVVHNADVARQLELIRAHPDLVGRLAREGRLGLESTQEQASAGLSELTEEEIKAFETYNSAYHERFGFPFVICARRNRKEAILAALPQRLEQTKTEEIRTALAEIGDIALLRMADAVREDT
jgi:2-oxo-4-hydroxy-4-carboxy-5-ureidoimidazoline decarboxylase